MLGDLPAIRRAYPKARDVVLRGYANDAVCGTWEVLANAVYRGGVSRLKTQGFQTVGQEKSRWAETIAPHIEVDANTSPSFRYFRDKLRELANPTA